MVSKYCWTAQNYIAIVIFVFVQFGKIMSKSNVKMLYKKSYEHDIKKLKKLKEFFLGGGRRGCLLA